MVLRGHPLLRSRYGRFASFEPYDQNGVQMMVSNLLGYTGKNLAHAALARRAIGSYGVGINVLLYSARRVLYSAIFA